MSDYIVRVGMNYGPTDKRAEPGDVVNDLPGESLPWLLEQGVVEPVQVPETPLPTSEMVGESGPEAVLPEPAPDTAPVSEVPTEVVVEDAPLPPADPEV